MNEHSPTEQSLSTTSSSFSQNESIIIDGQAGTVIEAHTTTGRANTIRPDLVNRIKSYLEHNNMREILTNQHTYQQVLVIFRQLKYQLPKTLTSFLYNLTCKLIILDFTPEERAALPSSSCVHLEELPKNAEAAFGVICHLALEHLLYGHKYVNFEESSQFLLTFLNQESRIMPEECFRFGLVERSTHIESARYAYAFLCPTMVEFLAAFYLYQQPPLNQLYFLFKNSFFLFENGFTQWLCFFFGLIGENYTAHLTLHNPIKFMINTVMDVLVYCMELNYDSKHRYSIIKCMYEFQENSLFQKLASRYPAVLSFSLPINNFSMYYILPVLFLITKSGCAEWTIMTSLENREYGIKLKELAYGTGVSIIVRTDPSCIDDTRIELSTAVEVNRDTSYSLRNITNEERAVKLNQFCCCGVREILRRVLSLYDAVEVEGNVSSISFLTCRCFKESYLRFFPFRTIHYLLGPKKDFTGVSLEPLSRADRHNLEKHNGESIEVLIMLRPMVERVEGIVPMTNEKFTIVLSQDLASANYKTEPVERCVDANSISSSFNTSNDSDLPNVNRPSPQNNSTQCSQGVLMQNFVEQVVDEITLKIMQPHLDQSSALITMCTLVLVHFQKYQQLKTLTDFMYKLSCELVVHNLVPEERAGLPLGRPPQLEKLPETAQEIFNMICHLAVEHLLRGHECVDLEESYWFLSSFSLSQSRVPLEECFRFGLVERSTHIESARYAYEFLCPTMVEFLAAFYLYQQPPLNQLYFLFKNSLLLLKNGFTRWLRFFFGLLGRCNKSSVTQQNPTKLMMNTVVDVLIHSLELKQVSEYRYHLIECIHEFQDTRLLQNLALKYQFVLNFSIKRNFNSCIQPVSSLINESGFAQWTIHTSLSNAGSVLKLIAQLDGVSIEIKIAHIMGEMVSIRSERDHVNYFGIDGIRRALSGKEKTEKFNQFCCCAVREIFQKIFSIYSEVKLKGDASNPCCVSFLTCECFKKLFLKHVKLFPLLPVHFLPVPRKNFPKIRVIPDATDQHNLAKHNGESMEVVIMLRPLVQKVEGIIPITSEEFSLILSRDLVLDFSDVESEMVSVERFRNDDEVDSMYMKQILPVFPIVQKTIYGRSQTAYPRPFLPPPPLTFKIFPEDDCQVDSTQTEKILPVLPIVQKTIYGRSQTAYPRPFLPPPQAPKIDTGIQILPEEANVQNDSLRQSNSVGDTNGLHAGSKVMMPVHDPHASSVNPYLLDQHRHSPAQALMPSSIQPSQGVFVQNVEQAVGEVRVHPATARRQTALRPGTVLYTSMPEKLPSDRIQPLPLQRTLIRKGGNGSIFSENVGGTAMAVKKTSYRSKEYAIITKIRHKNIIPLLAYVWGEEHRENKRRYYVYHYLPKLSGDLARLVTNKEELSLYEFNKIHQYTDFKAVGVAVSNVKYILSQVLQGLQYLHKSHIAHRDLKASNVLIKFFCACSSPIVCGCEVKYQVVLCDFDAAIELDSQDHVPVTPSPPSRPHTGAAPHAEIVPVGTNGFRSPESSMLTIANTPEAFSPPLTTKTDIYSFGILCMRLMISTDTPYSQRTMATLLLHYHQIKGLSEGRIGRKLSKFHKLDKETTRSLAGREWPDFLRIDEATVLKILKLKKLRPRMAWLRRGFEFVRQCLSVDPEARPSASDLLKDPFLNSSYS